MDNMFEIGLLLDFYGQMLTDRQYEVMDLHYNEDYSFSEIAEHLGISRQGAYDYIRRGRVSLIGYERKLGLAGRFLEHKNKAGMTLQHIEELKSVTQDPLTRRKLDEISRSVREIFERQ